MAKIQCRADKLPISIGWESVNTNFSALWIADGSTLEDLRKKLKGNEDSKMGLGGRMMMIVEPFHHQPVATWYTKNSTAHDQTWTEKLLERLPVRGLLIFDLGFFNFMRIISFLASFVTG